jgi:hypothetical protein
MGWDFSINLPEVLSMLDSIVVEGMLTAYSKSVNGCPEPARIAFLRRLGQKWRNRAAEVASPFTGAPIAMSIRAAHSINGDHLFVRFHLPLASALVGHSCLHGWTECLDLEKATASRLLRLILEQHHLSPNESSGFILSAQATVANLVWHIAVGSRLAAKELLLQAVRQVRCLHAHNDLPRIGIADYIFTEEPTECSLQVILKAGNGLKLSIQPEKLPAGPELHRARGINAADVRGVTKSHVRVQAMIGKRLIDGWGIENPHAWSQFGLESCVDTVLRQSGFMTPYLNNPANLSVAACTKEVRDIHALYLRDPSLPGINKGTVNRLRDVLLELGADIGMRPQEHRQLDGSIGKRLHYSNRWKVPEDLRKFMVSKQTSPGLDKVLSKQLRTLRQDFA